MTTAITFDLDGTLATYDRPWTDIVDEALGDASTDGAINTFGTALQTGLENLRADSFERAAAMTVREHGLDRDPAVIAKSVRNAEVAATVAIPGARQLVSWATERGPVGLITNGDDALQRRKAQSLGLLEPMDTVVVSCGVDVAKPDTAIFEAAAANLGVADGIHFGDDRTEDVGGALAAGWEAIHVDDSASPDEAVAKVNHLSRLVDLLSDAD